MREGITFNDFTRVALSLDAIEPNLSYSLKLIYITRVGIISNAWFYMVDVCLENELAKSKPLGSYPWSDKRLVTSSSVFFLISFLN